MKKKIDQAKLRRLEEKLKRAADKARYFQERIWEQEEYFERLKTELWEADPTHCYINISFKDAIA